VGAIFGLGSIFSRAFLWFISNPWPEQSVQVSQLSLSLDTCEGKLFHQGIQVCHLGNILNIRLETFKTCLRT
jgi:hypothetical protein